MAHDLQLAATGTDDLFASAGSSVIDLDLTDEHGMLCEDYAERNPEGTRALLAALNLQASGPTPEQPEDGVFDLAIYRATGSRRLASLFGTII